MWRICPLLSATFLTSSGRTEILVISHPGERSIFFTIHNGTQVAVDASSVSITKFFTDPCAQICLSLL